MQACKTCKPNMKPLVNGVCVCESDFFFDHNAKICVQCDGTCSTCVDTFDKCLSCKPGKVLQKFKCVDKCDDFEYLSQDVCYPCDLSCKQCTGPTSQECTVCHSAPDPDTYLEGNMCLTNCSSSFYKSNSPNVCMKCFDNTVITNNDPLRCLECISAEDYKCTSCPHNTFLQKADQADTFGQCLQKCIIGQYASQLTNTCELCDPACEECKDNATNCQVCATGYFLKGNACVDKCGDPYYELNKECIKCDYKCIKCEYKTDPPPREFCNKCSGYKTNLDGTCQNICQPGEFSDVDDICHKCDPSCDECSDLNNNNCTKCKAGSYLEENTCKAACDKINHWGNGANNNCDTCNNTCRSCTAGTDKDCKTCDASSGNERYLQGTQCDLECHHFSQYHDKSDPDNYICKDCEPTCLACKKYEKDECTACRCDPSLNFTDLQCEQNPHKAMKFFHKNKCIDVCPNDTIDGQLFGDRATMTCKKSCKEGEYADPLSFECTKCPPECTLCTGKDLEKDCQACVAPYYKATAVTGCFKYCFSDEYKDDATRSCKKCDKNCRECTGPNPNQCLSCNDDDYQLNTQCYKKCPKPYWGRNMEGVLQCIANCSSGEYGDSYDPFRKCKPCDLQCSQCYGEQKNMCTSCKDTWFLLFTTCDLCPIGYYGHPSRRECVYCHATCEGCKGESDKDCTSCQTDRYLLNNICYSQCPQDYYAEVKSRSCVQKCPETNQYEDKSDNTCRSCHSNCKTCIGPTFNECKECANGFFQKVNSCLSVCPIGYFPDTNMKCIPCHTECETCFGVDNTQCQSCKLPKIFYQNMCISQCPAEMFKHPFSNSCVAKCPKAYYPNTSSAQCLPCHSFCDVCFGSGNTKCNSCKSPYLFNNNTCSESCLPGTYPDGKGSCSDCDQGCKTCFGKTNESCIICNSGYFKQGDTQCVSECIEGKIKDSNGQKCIDCPASTYYENKECKNCHPSCKVCSGPLENECIECIETRGKNDSREPASGICQCAPGYLEVNKIACEKGDGSAAESTKRTSEVTFYLGEATSGLYGIAGQGTFSFYNLMDFCQYVSYFQFLNVKYPLNVKQLFKNLYISHFTSLLESDQQKNNSNSRLLSSEIQEYSDSKMKFTVNNRIYPLRITFLPLILLNFVSWIVIAFISLLGYLLKTKNNSRKFLIEKIIRYTHFELGLQIFQRTLMELFLFLFLQAKINIWDSLDIFTVIVVATYVLVVIGFISKQSFREFKTKVTDEKLIGIITQEQIQYNRVKFLFEDKKEDLFSKNLALSQIIFKLIFTSIIVFIIESPEAQVLGILILKVVFFGLYLMIRPYKQLSQNVVFLVTELLMVGIALSIFMFVKYQNDANRDKFGWAILILIVVAILINFVVIILQFLVFLLKKFCLAAIKTKKVINEQGVEREEELSSDFHYATDNSKQLKNKIVPVNDEQSQYQENIQKDYVFNLNNSIVEPLNYDQNNNSSIINGLNGRQQNNTLYLSEQDELFQKPGSKNASPNKKRQNQEGEDTEQREVKRSQLIQRPLIHNIGMIQNQLDSVIKIDKLQIYDDNELKQIKDNEQINEDDDSQLDYEQIQLEQNEKRPGTHSSSASWHNDKKKWRDDQQSRQNLNISENQDDNYQYNKMQQPQYRNKNSIQMISKTPQFTKDGNNKNRGSQIPEIQLQSQVNKMIELNEKERIIYEEQRMNQQQMIDWRQEQQLRTQQFGDNQMIQNYRQGLDYYEFPQSYIASVQDKNDPNQNYDANQGYIQTHQGHVDQQGQKNKKIKNLPNIIRNEVANISQEVYMDQQNYAPFPLNTQMSQGVPQFKDFTIQSEASVKNNGGQTFNNNMGQRVQRLSEQYNYDLQQRQEQEQIQQIQQENEMKNTKNQSFLVNLVSQKKNKGQSAEDQKNNAKFQQNQRLDTSNDDRIIFSKNEGYQNHQIHKNEMHQSHQNNKLVFDDNRDNLSIQQYNYTQQGLNSFVDDMSQSLNKSIINMSESNSPDRFNRLNSIQKNKKYIQERARQTQHINEQKSELRNNSIEDQSIEDSNNPQSVLVKLVNINQESSLTDSAIKTIIPNKRLDNITVKPTTIQEDINNSQGQTVLEKKANLQEEFQKLSEQKSKMRDSQYVVENQSVESSRYIVDRELIQQGKQKKNKTKITQAHPPHQISFQRQSGLLDKK